MFLHRSILIAIVCTWFSFNLSACNAIHSVIQSQNQSGFPQPLPEFNRILLFNGVVLTMEEDQPQIEAILIRDLLIERVGSSQELLDLADESTLLIDLEGKMVLPGFVDSHSHWIGGHAYDTPDEAVADALRNGWTSINELTADEAMITELVELDNQNRLRLRLNLYPNINFTTPKNNLHYLDIFEPRFTYSPHLGIAGIKIFIDHFWGRTSHWSQAELNDFVSEAQNKGWQVASHTLSARAHDLLLNAFEHAQDKYPVEDPRHRIEHAVQMRPDQIMRSVELGLITSVQLVGPGDAPEDPAFARLFMYSGPESLMPWRDYFEAGLITAGGLDWPGSIINSPIQAIHQAVTRIGLIERELEPWQLQQTLTVEQALRALTINGAYATFEEGIKGSLTPGKYADLVVLSENPLTVSVDTILDIQIEMTMVGGSVEYCAIGSEFLCPQYDSFEN